MNHQPRKLLENYRDLQYTKNEKILNGKLHFLRSVTFFADGSRLIEIGFTLLSY